MERQLLTSDSNYFEHAIITTAENELRMNDAFELCILLQGGMPCALLRKGYFNKGK